MRLKLPLLYLLFCTVDAAAQQSDFEYEAIRNLKAPLLHVFHPDSVKEDWLTPAGSEYEMPMPSGMSEKLRREVDAERSRFNQRNIKRRDNLSGNPTDPASIKAQMQRGWDGTSGGGTPNDNHIAVSNSGMVVSVMNTVIRVTNDTGRYLRGWSLEYFANNPNKKIDNIPALTRVYDPRVLYDPVADRFIVLFMHGTTDQTSFIVVGFSQTNDPSKPWNVYRIPGKPTKDLIWSDYPIVAHNSTDLFFTVNLIGNGASWEEGFTEAIIWQINKADGYNGDTLNKNFYSNIKYKGQALRSICAIQNGPLPEGSDNYFISVKPIAKVNDTVFVLRVTNTQRSGLADLTMKVMTTPQKYGFPPSALQPDTSYKLRTNDARVLSAIRLGNTIQYLQNSINFATYQAHLTHCTVFDIEGSPYIRAGMITDDSLDMGYPAIAAAGRSADDPSAVITFVYSSPWHMPGTGVIYRNRYGEYSRIVDVKRGKSLIFYSFIPKGEQRWGDYEGIQRKFNEPNTYYMVGSYGNNQYMNAWIARITLNDQRLDAPVDNVRVFPVPAAQDVYLEVKVEQPGRFTAELVNMTGQQIKGDLDMYLSGGTHKLRMDRSNLAPGVYVLRLKKDGRIIHSQKIQIQ